MHAYRIAAATALLLSVASAGAQEAAPAAPAAPAAEAAVAPVTVAPVAAAAPVPAPIAAPAAPKAAVTVGGTLNVNLQRTQAKGATQTPKTLGNESIQPRNAVSTDSSNVFVDAYAEVAGGLKVIARCETTANVDGISGGLFCSRNSRVGLSSAYGTLFYGNWDTPFKTAAYGTKVDDPFGNTDVFGHQGLVGSPGFNARSGAWVSAAGASVHAFDSRAANSVAYHSPKLFGASLKVQYSVDEFASQTGKINPNLLSTGLSYEWSGLSVVASYERREDGAGLATINRATGADFAFGASVANSATQGSVDFAWKLGAGYELETPAGKTTVSVLVDQLTYQQDKAPTNAVTEYKRLGWQVAAKHRYGDHEVRARYNAADAGDCELAGGATCSTDEYGATQVTVGYAYHLSKAAQAYLSFTRISNEEKAQYTPTIGGASAIAGATPKGADPQALGLGLRYAF